MSYSAAPRVLLDVHSFKPCLALQWHQEELLFRHRKPLCNTGLSEDCYVYLAPPWEDWRSFRCGREERRCIFHMRFLLVVSRCCMHGISSTSRQLLHSPRARTTSRTCFASSVRACTILASYTRLIVAPCIGMHGSAISARLPRRITEVF